MVLNTSGFCLIIKLLSKIFYCFYSLSGGAIQAKVSISKVSGKSVMHKLPPRLIESNYQIWYYK